LAIPSDIEVVVNALSLECLQQGLGGDNLIESLLLLAQACAQRAIPLIQLSSSEVFDGFDGGRHREVDDVVPASQIGALLSRMEALLPDSCSRHIVLRVGPVFSSREDNLLTRLLEKFQRGETLSFSSGGKCSPLHSKDLARVLSAIIDQLSCGCESWGTYHYNSSDPASSYQFAETVLAVLSQYTQSNDRPLMLESIDAVDLDWSKPVLNCEKILNTFGIKQLPWRAFVVPTVKKIFEAENRSAEFLGEK
jgi:dTDP-4-dehydrorhamnose reductase